MTPELKSAILSTLNDLLNGEIQYKQFGICGNLTYFWSDSYDWIHDNSPRWPEFSGDGNYPIGISNNPYNDYHNGDLWEGEYGEKRRRFVEWMIKEISQIETFER